MKLTADKKCLEQACRGLLTDFRAQVEVYAGSYGVPAEILAGMAQDVFLFERAGYPVESVEFWSGCAQEAIREREEAENEESANTVPLD